MTLPAKSHLRQTALSGRQAIAPDDHNAWSQACCKRLCSYIETLAPSPRIIAGYSPIRAELDPGLALASLGAGFTLALPAIVRGSRLLSFRPMQGALAAGAFGILEPAAPVEEVVPDIVLVPLTAFDRRGHRLGYGAGYYDATLAHLRSIKPIAAIGLGFASQEIERVPDEAFDHLLDLVITETEIIRTA